MTDVRAGRTDGRRSLGELLRDLAEGSAQLVRDEAQLARNELTELLRGVAAGSAQVAIGSVLALLGVMALVTGLIILAGDQWFPNDMYWLAALVVTVILGVVAWWTAARGKALLSPERLAPDETVETLKEDKEWLKRRLTSGATSS